jgi:MFS transporter, PPP family, 3-phenylpropionic acid transporter
MCAVRALQRKCMPIDDSHTSSAVPVASDGGRQDAPPHFAFRVSLLFFGLSISHGIALSFFPQWLASLGYSASAVGVILSAQLAVRTLAVPLISGLADRAQERATVLTWLGFAGFAVSLGYLLPQEFCLSLALSLLIVPFWGAKGTLADSIALSGQRRFGADYARMRLWGSLAFLAANLAAGWLTGIYGIDVLPVLFCIAFALFIAISLGAPRLGPVRSVRGRMNLAGLFAPDAALRNYTPLALAGGIIIGSHGFFYAFSAIHYASIGHSQLEIGLLWAWSVLCEVVLFWHARRFLDRFAPEHLVMVGGIGAIARWLLVPFAPLVTIAPLAADFALQSLHAISFALTYIALQKAVANRFSDGDTGAALGLNFFLSGVTFAVTTLIGGRLFESYGMMGLTVMAGFCVAAMVIAARIALRAKAMPA